MDTKTKIKQYITQNILLTDQDFPCGDDASFLDQGIIDSLGFMELVAFVEKECGIQIWPQDLVPDNFDSVNKLERYIDSRLATARCVA
jgi:acyl carrier protein